jgi:hypothetical protein
MRHSLPQNITGVQERCCLLNRPPSRLGSFSCYFNTLFFVKSPGTRCSTLNAALPTCRDSGGIGNSRVFRPLSGRQIDNQLAELVWVAGAFGVLGHQWPRSSAAIRRTIAASLSRRRCTKRASFASHCVTRCSIRRSSSARWWRIPSRGASSLSGGLLMPPLR